MKHPWWVTAGVTIIVMCLLYSAIYIRAEAQSNGERGYMLMTDGTVMIFAHASEDQRECALVAQNLWLRENRESDL